MLSTRIVIVYKEVKSSN